MSTFHKATTSFWVKFSQGNDNYDLSYKSLWGFSLLVWGWGGGGVVF